MPMPEEVEIRGRFGSLLVVNVAAALAAGLMLVPVILIRPGITAGAFPVIWGMVVVWLAADTVYWRWRGVHRAVLDGEALHVYRGRTLVCERIPVSAITDVHLHRRLARRSLQILLGGEVTHVPGMTLFPGRKVWITSDAFDEADFDRFAEAALRYRGAPAHA
jgi:hypothetical protein